MYLTSSESSPAQELYQSFPEIEGEQASGRSRSRVSNMGCGTERLLDVRKWRLDTGHVNTISNETTSSVGKNQGSSRATGGGGRPENRFRKPKQPCYGNAGPSVVERSSFFVSTEHRRTPGGLEDELMMNMINGAVVVQG